MAHLMPPLKQQFLDDNGRPLVGGKVYTYQAGTSTPLATYQDKAESVANDNPVVLDANGEADIWLGSSAYKVVVKDSNDVTIRTVDGVAHQNIGSVTTALLADGILSADSVGRAKMADGFLSADATGRAKMADGFITQSHLATGTGLNVGNTVLHHTFGGALPIPRGWMPLTGLIVNQTDYDSVHGAGAYVADDVGNSPIAGKHLPDQEGRYAVGAAATTQDGETAFTPVGNTGNEVSLLHSHPVDDPEWQTNKVGPPQTYSNGTLVNYSSYVSTSGSMTGLLVGTGAASSLSGVSGILWGSNISFQAKNALTTEPGLSATQSIQPDSNEFIYIMKVV